jgi:hypothetical protein
MKRLIIIALLSFVASAVFADSEELDFYTGQFNNADTVVEQLAVVRSVIDQEIADADSFYAASLSRLLSEYPSTRAVQELNAADDMAQRLVKVLGTDQYTDAAHDVWRVVRVFSNAMVKSEALIALGAMNATDLLPQVLQTLTDTNTRGPINRTSGERIAYGAIVSLASYNDPSGYVPVFFAANGWYSNWIKRQAADTLAQLQENPSEPLTSVIQNAGYNFEQKYMALSTIEKSSASDEEKAAAAVTALDQGWRGTSGDPVLRGKLISMRKLALDMISRYGSEDETVLPLLNRSYRYGADEEEQFNTIAALAKIANDDAVQLLGTYVIDLNEKQARKAFKQMDERRIRALIGGLGATQNPNAKPYLQLILGLDWTTPIVKLARQASDNL